MRSKSSFCLLLLFLTGCITPNGTKVVEGVKFPREAVAFLDFPDATREETIATLGPPSWESTNSRVLLYTYATSLAWNISVPDSFSIEDSKTDETRDKDKEKDKDKRPDNTIVIDDARSFQEQTHLKRWGLFIAYNEKGLITGHDISPVGNGLLEGECKKWVDRHTSAP